MMRSKVRCLAAAMRRSASSCSRLAATVLAVGLEAGADPGRAQNPSAADPWITAHLDELVGLYTHLHTHPELSLPGGRNRRSGSPTS